MILTPDVELFPNIFSTREDSNIIIKTYDSSRKRKRKEIRIIGGLIEVCHLLRTK